MTAESPEVLQAARQALDRGDYGQVLRLLQVNGSGSPKSGARGDGNDDDDGPRDNEGDQRVRQPPEVLLLLATAHMGLGQSEAALACCRRLRQCGDAALQAQARELQRVLEAPSLRRPRGWSLTLPDLQGSDAALGRRLGSVSRRRRPRNQEPPPPAVGPTRAPLGFALLVVLLTVLALLLGGCGSIRSELHVHGPGRLQVRHQLDRGAGAMPSWQQQWAHQLAQQGWQQQRLGQTLSLSTPVLPSRQALDRLGDSLVLAARLGGVTLPRPALRLYSRNWLIAVNERIGLELDLSQLPPWIDADLELILQPLSLAAVKASGPEMVQPLPQQPDTLLWRLRSGSLNQLELQLWHWSPLGLGGLLIAALLLLSLALQRLRRQLGFGWPELPR